MQLIGYMDSPFVRRVAVSAQYLGIPYEHRELSIFREFEEFRAINPLVKVPTLICDDGQTLVDSTLIIDHLESIAGKSLMPAGETDRIRALNIIGTSMVAMEKVAQLIYETKQRPEEVRYAPWIERLETQLLGALELMESAVGDGTAWIFGNGVNQADITAAIGWRFVQHVVPERAPPGDFPGLVSFSARAEELAEFVACPLS
jgi:glutathione S-transferase